MEFAAQSFFVLYPDTTAHKLHEPLANRKSESGAAVASRGGHIRLRKCFKNLFLLVLGYSDADVGHRELQEQAILHGLGNPRVNRHLSVVGEF
jgi:hypothetical protein